MVALVTWLSEELQFLSKLQIKKPVNSEGKTGWIFDMLLNLHQISQYFTEGFQA